MLHSLHAVLVTIWQSGVIPLDLLGVCVIIPWKGNDYLLDCSNYRGITILSITGKVLTHIHHRHIRDHLLKQKRLEQSGFIPDKCTVDCILTFNTVNNESLGRP